jgi:hypothetical protein
MSFNLVIDNRDKKKLGEIVLFGKIEIEIEKKEM